MKKLVFMFVAVAAISFASCGNKAEAPVEGTDSIHTDTIELNDTQKVVLTITEAGDTTGRDTIEVEAAPAETPAEATTEAPAETTAE